MIHVVLWYVYDGIIDKPSVPCTIHKRLNVETFLNNNPRQHKSEPKYGDCSIIP